MKCRNEKKNVGNQKKDSVDRKAQKGSINQSSIYLSIYHLRLQNVFLMFELQLHHIHT
jgi:hypothetical protein